MTQRSPFRRSSLIRLVVLVATIPALTFCTAQRAREHRGDPIPLAAPEVRSDYGMVSAGSEEAARAGASILEQGGNAVDAAVAAAFALGVSDPGGSGLGGLTYVLISTADGRDIAVDGSTPAPFVVDKTELQEIKDAKGRFRTHGRVGAHNPGHPRPLARKIRDDGPRHSPRAGNRNCRQRLPVEPELHRLGERLPRRDPGVLLPPIRRSRQRADPRPGRHPDVPAGPPQHLDENRP